MPDMSGVFGCEITDRDYIAAFAPEQPNEVTAGQNWMRASDGAELPVKRVRGEYVALGGTYYTVVVSLSELRYGWVCTDLPPLTPVTELRRG